MPIGLILKFGIPAIVLIAIVWLWNDRNGWKDKANGYLAELNSIVVVVRTASGNPEVTGDTVKEQISALGDSNRSLKISLDQQSLAVDEMAKEAIRLKAKNKELQEIANRARDQRSAAMNKLSEMTISPSEAQTCEELIDEANRALDLVYEQGNI
jgi:hypothetical protein